MCKHLISIPLVCSSGLCEFSSYLLPALCSSSHLYRPTVPTLLFIKVCVCMCVFACHTASCAFLGLWTCIKTQQGSGLILAEWQRGTERLAGRSEDEQDFVILAKARELERCPGALGANSSTCWLDLSWPVGPNQTLSFEDSLKVKDVCPSGCEVWWGEPNRWLEVTSTQVLIKSDLLKRIMTWLVEETK